MATAFKMPQLGETVIEGTITRWLKKEGETVEADEPLVEISTDKVDSEIPAPVAGTVSKINFQEGDTVKVGEVIAEIGDASGAAAPQAEPPEAQAPETTKPQEPETEPTEQHKAETPSAPAKPAAEANGTQAAAGERSAEEAPPQPPVSSGPQADEGKSNEAQSTEARPDPSPEEPGPAHSRRGILSPLVRRLASQYKVDLSTIKGTGTGGRITKQDVLTAAGQAPVAEQAAGGAPAEQEPSQPAASGTSAQQPQSAPATPAQLPAAATGAPTAPAAPSVRAPAASGDEIVQVTTMRKSIAEHMVASLHETARAWNTIEIDLTNIARLREQAGPAFKQKEGFSLTWMPFVSKAVTQALQRYPQVNATWNGDGTITRKHYVNLGIAVALENGLIVPVVKGADGMNIVGLARGVRDVATRARSKKLVPDDVQGGTFTITNPGPFGSILSVPIINKGQAAILAFDAVVKRPVVVTDEHGNDSIAIRHMVFISMSWDHRVIDGAEAAQFLAYLKELLEEADYSSDISGYLPGS